jgi:hypothetical protein
MSGGVSASFGDSFMRRFLMASALAGTVLAAALPAAETLRIGDAVYLTILPNGPLLFPG